MNTLRKYEKDERNNLRKIIDQMNRVHATMGGRDERPERLALLKCMQILQAEIDRANREELTK